MVDSNENIYAAYKPFRNHLYKVEVVDSLYAIWAYMRNIEHQKPFPPDVGYYSEFLKLDLIQKIRILAPWDLEIMARDVIAHSYLNLPCQRTLRDWNYFGGAINKLKQVEGAISIEYINPQNIMKELAYRLSHRQFGWQVYRANTINLARYFRIFNNPKVSKIIEAETGLSTQKIFGIGIALWNHFTEKFKSSYINFDLPEIQNADVKVFEEIFCIELSELKPIVKSEIRVNEKFNYAFHSLKRFPLLRNSQVNTTEIMCPLPGNIFKQITSGIYYLVKWTGPAGNALGAAYQQYIGDVLYASKLTPDHTIIPEERFGKSGKDTVDWVVTDQNSALFVECKTKRLTFSSKEELLEDESTEKDLEQIAKAVVQSYKTIQDYRSDLYPVLPFKEDRLVYPIVVTMEDWFLMGESLRKVHEKVLDLLKAESLPLEWLETMPFSVCSTQEFEWLSQLLNHVPIKDLIETKQKDKEMKEWTYSSYLSKKYKEHSDKLEELFPNIFHEILPLSLANIKKSSL
jgi:hypothetical protein